MSNNRKILNLIELSVNEDLVFLHEKSREAVSLFQTSLYPFQTAYRVVFANQMAEFLSDDCPANVLIEWCFIGSLSWIEANHAAHLALLVINAQKTNHKFEISSLTRINTLEEPFTYIDAKTLEDSVRSNLMSLK